MVFLKNFYKTFTLRTTELNEGLILINTDAKQHVLSNLK